MARARCRETVKPSPTDAEQAGSDEEHRPKPRYPAMGMRYGTPKLFRPSEQLVKRAAGNRPSGYDIALHLPSGARPGSKSTAPDGSVGSSRSVDLRPEGFQTSHGAGLAPLRSCRLARASRERTVPIGTPSAEAASR